MEAAAKYIETLQNNLVVKIRTHGYPDKLKNCNNGNRRGDDYDSIRRAVDNYACQTMKWLLKISESRFDALRFIFHVDKKPYTINSINKVLTLLLFFKRLVHSYIGDWYSMYCRFFFWEPSIIYCKCIFSTFYDQVYYYCLLFSFICSARVRKVHSNCNQDWIWKIKLWKLVPIGKIISKMASNIFGV